MINRPVKEDMYQAKVACWNCDTEQYIWIKQGKLIPEWIDEKKVTCECCGCQSVQFFKEYLLMMSHMRGPEEESNNHQSQYG